MAELHEKNWAVITDEEVVGINLTNAEAIHLRDAHSKVTDNGGTCVVTNKVAERLLGKSQIEK